MLWTFTRRKQCITLNLFLNCVGEIQMFCTLIATMERVLLSVFGLWNMQNICKCCIFNWSLHGFVLIMWKCSLFKYLYFKCLLHWGLILLEEIKKSIFYSESLLLCRVHYFKCHFFTKIMSISLWSPCSDLECGLGRCASVSCIIFSLKRALGIPVCLFLMGSPSLKHTERARQGVSMINLYT